MKEFAMFTISPPSISVRRALFAIAVFLFSNYCAPRNVLSQSTTATLSGTVEDERGAVIPGATVIVINTGTRLERRAATNDQGTFVLTLLPPSTYVVRVDGKGFAPVEVQSVVLNVGDQKSLQIQLRAGNITEMVKIAADAPLISESPAVSTVIDRTFVENLPLNGRGFNSLLELTPGVTLAKTTTGNQGQFNVNGQRSSSNYFSVDGVSANTFVNGGIGLGQTGAGTLPAISVLGGLNALVSADALQEFRVQTSSFAPEYGRTPGAQISIATRSGTNDFHGSVFDYVRNDKFNANNWFANQSRLARPIERHNDFGGVVGGPIFLPRFGEGGRKLGYDGRNRTFFFFSYEGVRLLQPQTRVSDQVPSLAARQAAAPALKPYLNAFPLPNGNVLANGSAEFSATFSNPANLDSTSIRIDHSFKRTSVFFRFADAPSSALQRGFNGALNRITNSAFATRSFTAGVTSIISGTLSNDFRVNWTSASGAATIYLDDFGGANVPSDSLLFPAYSTAANTFFSFSYTGTNSSYAAGKNVDNRQKQVNLLDTVSWVRGNHSFKFGGDVRVLHPVSDPRTYDVTATFSGGVGNPSNSTWPAGTVLSGITSTGAVTTRTANFEMRYLNVSSFFQDTWKASSRLTITYGARYDVVPPPKGVNGSVVLASTNVDDIATLGFAPAGTPLWKTAYGNVAPRVGFAYSLRDRAGSPLMLRLGAGVFYDLVGSIVGNQSAGSAPFINTRNLNGVPFPYNAQALVAPTLPALAPFTAAAFMADPNLRTPRTYQWNVALEQGLGASRIVSATYVGAQGRNLVRNELLTNPNPNFVFISLVRSDAASEYHALQLQFRGKFRSYLQALSSYTWSHSIDTVSADSVNTFPASRIDPNFDRASSSFDVRHSFTSAVTFTMPKMRSGLLDVVLRNWSVDAIFRARTAFPVDVTVSRNLGFGNYAFRPDIIAGQAIYIDDPNAGGGRRIDNTRPPGVPNQVGPFLIPTTPRQGNLGRNTLRGFGMYQADIDIRRDFFLAEWLKLQLKAEFFNITNHPNFADPVGNLGSASATGVPTLLATFGRSTSMLAQSLGGGGVTGGLAPLYQVGGPRSMQFAVKFIF
jgi:hypothetical protein